MILIDKFASDFGNIHVLKSILTSAYAYWQSDSGSVANFLGGHATPMDMTGFYPANE
jgi:hypothetical protein